jgi:hypothetical protein
MQNINPKPIQKQELPCVTPNLTARPKQRQNNSK